MSHPVPGRDYGDNEHPSDSPHKDGSSMAHYGKAAKSKALKAKKTPRASQTVKGWAKQLRDVIGEKKSKKETRKGEDMF